MCLAIFLLGAGWLREADLKFGAVRDEAVGSLRVLVKFTSLGMCFALFWGCAGCWGWLLEVDLGLAGRHGDARHERGG